ncbi:MAG: replication-associated recombination protein A [Betaproteobacteria bacterium]|nr:replication-associated recombination protein A [Betaproteobacteria bacterium]MDH5287104.1 replication-associated recombination protein A [Betaproteobacteria bacterium]
MSDLFAAAPRNEGVPLAERLRPRRIDEVIGQRHLLGPGKPLAVAFHSGRLHSMILWGPPGVGKTTLARLMADAFNAEFIAISAVLAGVKEIRDAVARAEIVRAQSGRPTILFVDEVHRFNKAQQDAFLPYVEQGLLTFIGATTENPSFEVNSALLSRAAVYVLEPLSGDELAQLFERALAAAMPGMAVDAGAKDALVAYADGDGRRLINLVEQLAIAAADGHVRHVDVGFVERTIARSLRRFDKGGEAFYDQISALHKAVRGSDPDAALYWMCRMLDGGADPLYVGRRMIRMATEDVGLADPRALAIALDAVATYERLGSPEGELALAECVLYLAVTPKSNAVYVAYGAARSFIREDGSRPVPLRLRNAPTRLMKELGYGQGYRYAHDEPEAFAAGERYLPDAMPDVRFYEPTDRGLEQRIRDRLAALRARADREQDET